MLNFMFCIILLFAYCVNRFIKNFPSEYKLVLSYYPAVKWVKGGKHHDLY